MVKGKRNGLTFTERSVKICRFLLFSPPYWKWSYHNATQSECAHRLVDHWGSLSILQYRKWINHYDAKYWNVIKMVHLVSYLKPFQKIFGDRWQIEFTSLSLFHIQQGEKDAKTQSQQGKTSKVHSPPILELSFWAIRVFRDSLQASIHTKEEQGRQRWMAPFTTC